MRDAYLNGGSAFSGVIIKIQGGSITFADPDKEEAAWAASLRTAMQ